MAGGTIDYVLNLKADGTAATGEIGGLQSKVGGLDGALKGLGVAGLAAGVLAAVDQVANLQAEIGLTAGLLDLSAEDASRLTGALAKVGVEASDVAVFALDIAAGFEGNIEILDRLGIKAGDIETPLDAVKLAIDKWDLLTPVERIELFGEEAAIALGKLASGGETAIEILNDIPEARVYTQEQLDLSAEYVQNMQDAQLAAQGIVNVLAENVIPLLSSAAEGAALVGETIEEWSNDSEDVDAFFGNFLDQLGGLKNAFLRLFDRDAQQELQDNILNVRKDVVDLSGVLDVAARDRDTDIEVSAVGTTLANRNIDYAARNRNVPLTVRWNIPAIPGAGDRDPRPSTTNVTLNYGRAVTPSQFAAAARAWSFSNGGNPVGF